MTRACLAGVLGAVVAGSASAQQVLEIYGDSLTTYLPASAPTPTGVHNLYPLHTQRGVGIDGALRSGSVQGWACAGNPFGDGAGWTGRGRLGDVRLDTGTYSPTEVDMALPAPGSVGWVVARTFNGRQFDGSAAWVSNGYQGKNWMHSGDAELLKFNGSSDADDVLYVVYGADRYLEFRRSGTGSSYFKGKNGAAGIIKHTAGSINGTPVNPNDDTPEIYEYYDQQGMVTTFFGTVGTWGASYHQWKRIDAAGNVSFVGDASDALAARNGFSHGGVGTAYDAADRRYTYTYSGSAIGGANRLTQVKAETKTGGTWASPTGVSTVAQVDYAYYTSTTDDVGKAGDLKMVTITTPLSDSGVELVRKKHYRYYTRAWADSDGRRGETNQVKMVVGFEGCRAFDWAGDATLDEDFLSASESDLKPYAEMYLEYYAANDADNPLKVKTVFMNGQCGCGGGSGSGTYTLDYEESADYDDYLDTSGGTGLSYDTGWATRTLVEQPDGTWFTQYFDETGQPLSRFVTDDDPADSPTELWATEVVRNGDGQITAVHSPANNSTYTHSTGALTRENSVGLVTVLTRVASGDLEGFVEYTGIKKGNTPSTYNRTGYMGLSTRLLTLDTGVYVARPLVTESRAYHAESNSGSADSSSYYHATTTGFTWWETSTQSSPLYITPKTVTTTHPIVTTGNNGSNSATTSVRYLRQDRTTAFSLAQDGIYTYTKYAGGQLVMSIQDVKTNDTGDIDTGNDDPNGVFGITETGDGFHRVTEYAHDPQGRATVTTMPDGHLAKVYYSKIGDGRMATIALPAASSSTTVWYGPAAYSVTNHAGRPEVSCTLAVDAGGINTATGGKAQTDWITEATTDPLDALLSDFKGTNRANIHRLTRTIHDKPGTRVEETHTYTDVPSSTWGSSGTNYDPTTMAYDDMGRAIRTVDPTGTITRTNYDTLGRAIEREIGTDDTGDAGSTMSGTNNMVKVEATTYDAGGDGGNSHVTKVTRYIEDSDTDKRETSFQHDYRGRAVVTLNPLAPHTLVKFDNLGRVIASGQYSSTSGLDPGDDPTALTTNRVALSQTSYDQRGQVYRTTRHKIDQSDGSDDDSLSSDTWYDAAGRTIKAQGEQLTKTVYDRLGRVTHSFVLAKVRNSGGSDETAYADADDVDHDIVLEEHQTVHDAQTDRVLFSFSIQRHAQESATTYGALDSQADGDRSTITAANIKGRVQIAANWHDDLDRVITSVAYGTNSIVGDGSTSTGTFTRGGSPPSRPNTTDMQTDYAYDAAGNLRDVTDPLGTVMRTVYDDAGRRVATIANYLVSGSDPDENVTTRYVYTSGLQTAMYADIDRSGTQTSGDQVTSYSYGVTKGSTAGTSRIASNRLLDHVVYPEQYSMQSAAERTVEMDYNAQGQEIWREDQAGNVIQQDYDTLGRMTHKRLTAINTGAGFDDAIKRISYAYLGRGLLDTVTQYDNATAGSGTAKDQVQYTYDDWGNLTEFEQDPDSAIGASGRAAFSVQYTLSKNAPAAGRRTIRRDTIVLPGSLTLTYGYGGGGTLADVMSRTDALKISSTEYENYTYAGSGWLVGTSVKEPLVFSNVHSATLGIYPDLDRFNRTTSSRWTKDLGSDVDFYDVDMAYDLGSNITSTTDQILKDGSNNRRYDALYKLDAMNRLTEAEEGTLSGGGISNRRVHEFWTLTQTGNFDRTKLDLDGNGTFTGTDEYDDTRTHNDVNEIVSRDVDTDTSVDYTLVHDKVGNLTDDDKDYEFVYDPLGRLVQVKNQSNTLVSEYRYNGLGHRIGWHYDVDADGTVETGLPGDDPWYWFCYDEKWRIVATFRYTDASPKERFVYHAAGLGGYGNSSYIDSVAWRDRDANTSWGSAADGTLEERNYYCQNWRADVAAIVTDTAVLVEKAKYFSYGTPVGLPPGDTDSDGDADGTDESQIKAWEALSAYDVRGDMDLDGDVDATDVAMYTAITMGRGVLTRDKTASRKGYAGYENDGNLGAGHGSRFWHVRNRVLDSALERWTRRDPAGYVDGLGLYVYVAHRVIGHNDPYGLVAVSACGWQPNSVSDPAPPPPPIHGGCPMPPDQHGPPDPGCGFGSWCTRTYCIGDLIRTYEDCLSLEKSRHHIFNLVTIRACKNFAERDSEHCPLGSLQRNARRHCLLSCCLYSRLPDRAPDILDFHECCTIHIRQPNVDWEDLHRDRRNNSRGEHCAAKWCADPGAECFKISCSKCCPSCN